MLDTKNIEDLAKSLFKALPVGLQNVESEIKQTFKDILNATFARMDLVTREEFDVQVKVLARTREKLEALETEMNAKSSSIE
ncbi:MAG: accessory factor UbiK family protein [Legionellales bacterium]|nr:accessory factor UbiK family protein [Legionellales bacterium]